jgi:hypothetical protein
LLLDSSQLPVPCSTKAKHERDKAELTLRFDTLSKQHEALERKCERLVKANAELADSLAGSKQQGGVLVHQRDAMQQELQTLQAAHAEAKKRLTDMVSFNAESCALGLILALCRRPSLLQTPAVRISELVCPVREQSLLD